MFKYVLTVVIAFVAIVGGVWYMQSSDSKVADEPTSNIEVQSEAATTTTISQRCPTMTLECLSSQPEWNPTMEVEGMKRVDPPVREFEKDDLEYDFYSHTFDKTGDTVTWAALKEGSSPHNCAQAEEVSGDHGGCLKYPAELYNQFWILNETGKIVHQYKFTDRFIMVTSNKGLSALVQGGLYYGSKKPAATVTIFDWNYDQDIHIQKRSFTYNLDILTGEVTLQNKNPVIEKGGIDL